ncbi:hypothetical protein [Humisphaera borealis]|uniref:Uncharacterized protein n=1 Tax=Humisphaera borealis TaxID=2807512 RepID=A0A7M2X207_9BACT|nr:hypothetical protein [Humisphaera borealis]QOV91796.1 hypothetical protein IPV69_10755 [Humisphaera borealis]
MSRRPPKLNYASGRAGAAPLTTKRRRLIVAACCFGVSWLVWLVIGFVTFDSVDDTWYQWFLFLVGGAGTASGIVMFAIAHVIMELLSSD